MSARLVLVLGGTRSGKSRFGQARAAALAAGGPVTYLATAWPGDPELDERIAGHRAARPADWPTVEVGRDLAAAVRALPANETVLLDGLTLWLSGIVGDEPPNIDAILDRPLADALAAIAAHRGPVVVVSDEIGLGLVPLDPLSRAFRDLQGIAHQRIAAVADEVHFMVAGLPLTVRDR
ncbi:MAG TPA: bifunctional adenosylcobinamide kinase/adenosylcobinamide-phosphate guanylyltransferase [Candidatus Limnocylindrales bacterium]|nr:bifunctional adenosylcobinamide kinase/adenosylcobinamide-phosphate guanylyltransferase [Candidatus Limnocylindrales bacterium]